MTETTATPEKVWMTYADAESYTGYERTTLWRAVKRGELRQGGLPGSPRSCRDELNRWLRGDKECRKEIAAGKTF